MDYEAQLKLQAHLDGELPEGEAREVTNSLAKDREAIALYGELRNTRQALVWDMKWVLRYLNRASFFWSKIEREIRRLEPLETPVRPAPLLSAWRKWLIPAGAVAAVASAMLVGVFGETRISTVETAVADPAAFTYHDYSSKTTLVWFSYPADDEPADRTPAATVE